MWLMSLILCDRCVSLVFFRHIIPGHTDDNDGWSFKGQQKLELVRRNWNRLENHLTTTTQATLLLSSKKSQVVLALELSKTRPSTRDQETYDLRAIIHSFFNSILISQISPDVSHKCWITIWKMSHRISTVESFLTEIHSFEHFICTQFSLPVLSSTSFCTSFALNLSLTVLYLEVRTSFAL